MTVREVISDALLCLGIWFIVAGFVVYTLAEVFRSRWHR